jgi:hypothetical protein
VLRLQKINKEHQLFHIRNSLNLRKFEGINLGLPVATYVTSGLYNCYFEKFKRICNDVLDVGKIQFSRKQITGLSPLEFNSPSTSLQIP